MPIVIKTNRAPTVQHSAQNGKQRFESKPLLGTNQFDRDALKLAVASLLKAVLRTGQTHGPMSPELIANAKRILPKPKHSIEA